MNYLIKASLRRLSATIRSIFRGTFNTNQSLLATTPRPSYYFIVNSITLPARLLITLTLGLTLFCLPIAITNSAEKETPNKDNPANPETPNEAKTEKPSVKSLGDNLYQLGEIKFNGKSREIRFPATMNLEKGLLEYVIVTEEGKIHESLLSTKVRPAQLQIVLKLCHYREGVGDTFDALLPDEEKKGKKGVAERGSPIRIAIEWTEKVDGIDTINRHQIDELIRDLKADKPDSPMSGGQWIYTGSIIYDGSFIAEADGTMIAVYIDNGSLINSFRPGSEDDERWVTNAKIAPKTGTPITVIISPDTHEKPKEK